MILINLDNKFIEACKELGPVVSKAFSLNGR